MTTALDYYRNIIQPLQKPLLLMGRKGMPVDRTVLERERSRLEARSRELLGRLGQSLVGLLDDEISRTAQTLAALESERDAEHLAAGKRGKFSRAGELTKVRAKLKALEKQAAEGLNPKSATQKARLVYQYWGLPKVRSSKTFKSGGVDESVLQQLIDKLRSKKCKPLRGTREEVADALAVLLETYKIGWALSGPLNPVLVDQPGGKHPRAATQYNLHRTETGRLSTGLDKAAAEGKLARVTQLQNISREHRVIYCADPGWVFVNADYAAIEMVLAWYFASLEDYSQGYHAKLLDGFRQVGPDGKPAFDPHTVVAKLANCDRRPAKVVNFGKLYGGLTRNLLIGEGILPLSADEARRLIEALDQGYQETHRLTQWQHAEVARVKEQSFVETALGWRRYFMEQNPDPGEILSTKVSGTAADLMKESLVVLFRTCPNGAELVNTVHDSVMAHCPSEMADSVAGWMKKTLESPRPWLSGRSFRAEVKVGTNWMEVS